MGIPLRIVDECWMVRDGQTVREGSYWHGWIRNGELVDA